MSSVEDDKKPGDSSVHINLKVKGQVPHYLRPPSISFMSFLLFLLFFFLHNFVCDFMLYWIAGVITIGCHNDYALVAWILGYGLIFFFFLCRTCVNWFISPLSWSNYIRYVVYLWSFIGFSSKLLNLWWLVGVVGCLWVAAYLIDRLALCKCSAWSLNFIA